MQSAENHNEASAPPDYFSPSEVHSESDEDRKRARGESRERGKHAAHRRQNAKYICP